MGKAERVGWEADLDDGYDWIRDVDNLGWWDRHGTVYTERDPRQKRAYWVWVYIPARWVDTTTLLPWYAGPPDLLCPGSTPIVARWYPGTSAYGHSDNPAARWYARTCRADTFERAKRDAQTAIATIRQFLEGQCGTASLSKHGNPPTTTGPAQDADARTCNAGSSASQATDTASVATPN